MVQYKRITLTEREKIYQLKQTGLSNKRIAKILGRQTSTVSKELQRCNNSACGYLPDRAENHCKQRKRRNPKSFRSAALQTLVIAKLKEGWSPEQIAGRLKIEKNELCVSHETIYKYVYSKEGQLKFLPWLMPRKQTKRMKRMERKPRQSHIPETLSIANRPEYIAARTELGHWEGDLVVFSNKKSSNVTTLVERKSRFSQLIHNIDKCTETVIGNANKCFENIPKTLKKSCTFDRGSEFASYGKLDMQIFFCNPHSPWQKGGNENFNGRLRRYLPKTFKHENLNQELLDLIQTRMNNQPRKCLKFLTPHEAFYHPPT